MRAEKVIHSLLNGAAGVSALVADRIYPSPLPQGVTLPALAVEHISTVDLPTIDAAAPYALVQSRIEVTALAKDYPTQKSLIEAVRQACQFESGVIAGVTVVVVLRDGVGPDLRDDDMQVFSQSIDFRVVYHES